MITTFDRAIAFVLNWEGGLSEDPQDAGHVTNFGISKAAYPNVDIHGLTQDKAIEIYRTDYWFRYRCGELPAQLAIILFDSAVNQGPGTAIRALQESLHVRADGAIGAETIAAAQRSNLRATVPEFIAQRAFHYSLNRDVAHFGLGWFRRLAACQQLTQDPA